MNINITQETLQSWIYYMEKFEPMSQILYELRRDRLKRVGTKSEAIVGSANINEIAEISRND